MNVSSHAFAPANRHLLRARRKSKCFFSLTESPPAKLPGRKRCGFMIFVQTAFHGLKDESLEDSANLPDPDVIAAEIAEGLQAALDQFSQIAADLKQ